MFSPGMLRLSSRFLRRQAIIEKQFRIAAPYGVLRNIPAPRCYATSESLPRVAQPSLWHSIVPKFLRKSESSALPLKTPRSKEWNPATFYIVIFMLIGSNAIQMIALRNNTTNFNRNTDAKISLLKDVIGRVQRGEDVDVEGLLGTGDKAKEREWEDVIREIEGEDRLWQAKARKRKGAELGAEQAGQTSHAIPAVVDINTQKPNITDTASTVDVSSDATTKANSPYRGFY